MLFKADGVPRGAWALRDRKTGIILTTDICEDQAHALKLRRAQQTHQPLRGEMDTVPIVITVTAGN